MNLSTLTRPWKVGSLTRRQRVAASRRSRSSESIRVVELRRRATRERGIVEVEQRQPEIRPVVRVHEKQLTTRGYDPPESPVQPDDFTDVVVLHVTAERRPRTEVPTRFEAVEIRGEIAFR